MILQIELFGDAVSERVQSAVDVRVRVDDAPTVDQELCIGMDVL
jgi:hypothetical protein